MNQSQPDPSLLTPQGTPRFSARVAPPPLDPRPPLGVLFGWLSPSEYTQALEAISEDGATLFEEVMQAALGALKLSRGNPRERLDFYMAKPGTMQQAEALVALFQATMGEQGIPVAFSWEEQQLKDPEWYAEDMRDFERLKERAKAGDFND